MSSSVCVILVNFKNEQKTVDCLRALEKSTIQPACVCVVDNACTEESKQFFLSQTFGVQVRWIWNTENRGFAAACNQGIRALREEFANTYIWLLNNDTLPEADALQKLLEKAIATQAGITGSQIKKANGEFSGGVCFIHPKLATVRRPSSPDDTGFDYVEGSSFLISPDCLKKTGLLSEEYFLYFEESDYCWKAKRKGFTLAWETDSVIWHDIGSSTGSEIAKGAVPFFIDCLMIRNRIHFALKNGFPTASVLVGFVISLLLRLKRLQFSRVTTIIAITLSKKLFKKFVERNGGYYEIQD
ncbi:glycosyltransferase family 2 protein [Fibrobacter sp.]|uniref:glycosyltransferase family 2 protein n=1 Tax=Fibrobacter sp. TaxID=35828 RepID=UPI0038694E14